MSSEVEVTEAPEPPAPAVTIEELQEKWEAQQRDPTTRTSATSDDHDAQPVVATREHTAVCGHTWTQARIVDRWGPAECPVCREGEGPALTITAGTFKLDILQVLNDAGVNVRKYRDATLDNFDAQDDPHALTAARSYIQAWRSVYRQSWAPHDWMFLFGAGSARSGRDVSLGKLGNGKTHLAVAIARALLEAGVLDARKFVFATAERILLESEATFRTTSEDSEKNLLRRYAAPQLLIIDDVGVRDPSPHAVRLFDELTKQREAHATIWTSNLSVPVLQGASEYMKRITSRIAGECGDGGRFIVEFRGRNRRNERSRRSA